jgi:asparaginyl-tRNA synthetase
MTSGFKEEGFTYVHTPIITSNDCEGAGETFRVSSSAPAPPSVKTTMAHADEFFSKPAYLTVSSQLHLEALASSLSRVYTLSPCFRSERSMTGRHLAEFWMLEAEWAFAGTVGDVCAVAQATIKRALRHSLGDPEIWKELEILWKDKKKDVRRISLLNASGTDKDWTRMSYTDAVRELRTYHERRRSNKPAFAFEPVWGKTLQSEHEHWIAEHLVNGPVFVTDYPRELKPFYMRLNDDEKTVACFDLLVPHVGELVGGSVREDRVDMLERAIGRHGLKREEYEWYLDLRRFGNAMNGGFGMGFERLIGWLGGIESIRECIAMPRWTRRMLL